MNCSNKNRYIGLCQIILAGSAIFLSHFASAAVTAVTDSTNVNFTQGLSNFDTNGGTMNGLKVTSEFADGRTETLTWGGTGPDSGGVSGAGWGLSLSGSSFNNLWQFNNNTGSNLNRLTLDGRGTTTLFDRSEPNPGTADSQQGRDFFPGVTNGNDFEPLTAASTATYSDPVALLNGSAEGDLWLLLDIDIPSGVGDRFAFALDTDTSVNAIPLPGALLFISSGLAFLGFWGRAKNGSV